MKKVLVIAMVLVLAITAVSAAIDGPVLSYDFPLLITNAGQGPGGKQGRLFASRAKGFELDTNLFYKSEPGVGGDFAADLQDKNYGALFIVIGSTDKGLGASGITIDDEIARLEKMVKFCQGAGIHMVGVLLEKDKRASGIPTNPNERCIDTIMPYCEWMIVLKDGNKDKRFNKISEQYGIPLTIIDSAIDFQNLCAQVFVH